jgi:hypothetical protein
MTYTRELEDFIGEKGIVSESPFADTQNIHALIGYALQLEDDLEAADTREKALREALEAINAWCRTDDAAYALPLEPPWYQQLRAALALTQEQKP